MTDKEIFAHIFHVASQSKDPRGVVSACLVENGKIIASAASADDGVRHSEDLLLEKAKENNTTLSKNTALYCSLEPCSKRTLPNMTDCTSFIIESGIGEVVYGATDPDQTEISTRRLRTAGIKVRQISDLDIQRKCAEIFNSSVSKEHIGKVKFKPISES